MPFAWLAWYLPAELNKYLRSDLIFNSVPQGPVLSCGKKIAVKKSIEGLRQSYIYQLLQTIQMKLILLCVWAEPAVLGSTKTALKFKYKIQIGYYSYTIQCMGQFISFKSEINNP